MLLTIRWTFFIVGIIFFSYGTSIAIKMQYLGIHPWDVLHVGLYDKYGLSIGMWTIIIGIVLIIITWFLKKKYVKIGTFVNTLIFGSFVDFFLWLDILPSVSHSWTDIIIIIVGIVLMGFGGGLYSAAGVGVGPRDGIMLAISDKTGIPIRRVRIFTESTVLIVGLLLGGPVFILTFIFTFIQSPLFQYSYLKFDHLLTRLQFNQEDKEIKRFSA